MESFETLQSRHFHLTPSRVVLCLHFPLGSQIMGVEVGVSLFSSKTLTLRVGTPSGKGSYFLVAAIEEFNGVQIIDQRSLLKMETDPTHKVSCHGLRTLK